MIKRFVIIIREIKGNKLVNPIVKIESHEVNEYQDEEFISWRFYEETVDDMDLYDSDDVEVLVENNG